MKPPPEIKHLPHDKQTLLDDLLDQKSEGVISPSDEAVLRELVHEAEHLMVENAKRLAEFVRSQSPQAPTNAIPVTVWVKPSSAE